MILDVVFIRDKRLHKASVVLRKTGSSLQYCILNVPKEEITPEVYWTLNETVKHISAFSSTSTKRMKEVLYGLLNTKRIWVNKISSWW